MECTGNSKCKIVNDYLKLWGYMSSIAAEQSTSNLEAENNTFIISVSVSQEFGHKSSGSLLWVSQGCSPGVDLAAFSFGGLTGDESTSKLHAITGKIFFQLCD